MCQSEAEAEGSLTTTEKETDNMTKLDARGLSCPEPVIMISQAMKSGEAAYEILVDNRVSRENVTRYAEHQGYRVSVTENDGEFTLSISK